MARFVGKMVWLVTSPEMKKPAHPPAFGDRGKASDYFFVLSPMME